QLSFQGPLFGNVPEYSQDSSNLSLIVFDRSLDDAHGSQNAVAEILFLLLETFSFAKHQAVVGTVFFGQVSRVEVKVRFADDLHLREAHLAAKHAIDRDEAELLVLQENILLQILDESAVLSFAGAHRFLGSFMF